MPARRPIRALSPAREHGVRRRDSAYACIHRGIRGRPAGRAARASGCRRAGIHQPGDDASGALRMRPLVTAFVLVSVACTDVSTNPDAVVALRFEGSAYPSIVAGDSLRDSLGALQPLVATPLNYLNEPVDGVPVVFSSPDTVLRVFGDGVVYATRPKQADSVTLVYATVG